ncbi:MFS transporter [uncultured Parasphingorhabdus sp.]|uniref:MFS transporter n=1 Tax=uncultured Parasphingorhabdus sp. TaxID=2709694 RepID=UPI0030DA5CE1
MSQTSSATGGKLPISTRLLYGSGTIAFGVKDHGFNALLMLFYNQVIGLPAAWVGSAIMIAMIADALFDPLLGQYSDNFRSRLGRRHPFMYAAALPIGLFYLLLWSPPDASNTIQFAWLVTTAIFVRFSISLYEIPSTALLAEFTSDYDERTKLVAARFFFGVCGGLGMTVVTFGYFLQPTPEQPVGHLNAGGYAVYAWVAAAIMVVSVLISSLGTQTEVLKRPAPPPRAAISTSQMLKEMLSILVHPSYISILLASLFFAIASGINMALQMYFSTYLWELSANQIAMVASTSVIGIVFAFVVVLPLSVRFGKKSSALLMFSLALVSNVTPLILRLADLFPANGEPMLLWLLMGQFAFTMMATIAGGILAVSMVADVTDQIQLETGHRSEGLLFSASTMVNKAVSGMGILLAGLLLAFVNFPDNAQPGLVGDDVLRSLAGVYICTTLLATILAIICLAYYPINRSRHIENIRQLGENTL